MPLYDYRCEECAEVFEEEHGMDYEGPIKCPTCGTYMTQKVILETPGFWIYWKDARSLSEATRPKYLRPVRRKKRGGAEDYGGV